jgi:hypothetical protein
MEQDKLSCCRLLSERFPSEVGDVHPHIMRTAQLRRHKAVADQGRKERYCEAVRQNQRFGTAFRAACQQSKCSHALSSCRWQLPSSRVVALDRKDELNDRRGQRTNEFPDLSITTEGETWLASVAAGIPAGLLVAPAQARKSFGRQNEPKLRPPNPSNLTTGR